MIGLNNVVKRKGDGAIGTVYICDDVGRDGKSYPCPNGKCGGHKVRFHNLMGSRVCMTFAQLNQEFEEALVTVGYNALPHPDSIPLGSLLGKKVKHRGTGIFGVVHDRDGFYCVVSDTGRFRWSGLRHAQVLSEFEFPGEKQPGGCDHVFVPYTGLFETFEHCSKCGHRK